MLWKCLLVPLVALLALPPGWAGDDPRPAFKELVAPFLERNCTTCHGGSKKKAGLAFDSLGDHPSVLKDRKTWEKVLGMLRAQKMPPESRPRPDPQEVKAVTQWIEAELAAFDCTGALDPGRVTIRRLNRAEYDNTIRDLLGINFRPAQDFPSDDVGYGFDNIGDVLSLSPILLEKYLAAAEEIVERALAPENRGRIIICNPASGQRTRCAREILQSFSSRAYRRPATGEEVDRLVALWRMAFDDGQNFERSIGVALEAVLVSPHFLFRVELDRDPGNPIHPVSDHELATRLSYFLWSSMPDEELFLRAGEGSLRKDGNLEAQVRRMLESPRSRALVENFAAQWLQVRNLSTASPDRFRFPHFDEELRAAMIRETEMFFGAVMREDRSILEFLDSDFTFLNERLARHYGIPGVQGEEFRRVKLSGTPRGGVLTQASILTVTSNPTRTSPVKRGKWILEQILGAPPPPPPPGAGDLSEEAEAVLSGSLRQRMEKHRSNPDCAACHRHMDPLGFGLENFDAVGAWRDLDGKFPIDPSGTLPSGQTFQGAVELKAILTSDREAFARCLTEKMLTFALGRGLEYYDRCAVEEVTRAVIKDGYRFQTLVMEIVKSVPFQMRRSPEAMPPRSRALRDL